MRHAYYAQYTRRRKARQKSACNVPLERHELTETQKEALQAKIKEQRSRSTGKSK